MFSVKLCADVYVVIAVVVTAVVSVVVSGGAASTTEVVVFFVVVVVSFVVVFVVSAFDLSVVLGMSIASLVFNRLAVVDFLNALYIAAKVKPVPIPVAP